MHTKISISKYISEVGNINMYTASVNACMKTTILYKNSIRYLLFLWHHMSCCNMKPADVYLQLVTGRIALKVMLQLPTYYIYIYVCVFICLYIYTHTYIYIYTSIIRACVYSTFRMIGLQNCVQKQYAKVYIHTNASTQY